MVYQNVRILRVPTLGSQSGSLVSKTVSAVSFMPSVAWALWRRRADYRSLVITTNPPFVGVLGWIVSRVFRRPYLLIVYDVFPEFAISLGVMSAHLLMTDVVRLRAMSDAGRTVFLEKYTLTKAAAAYDAVLSSLSNGGPRPITVQKASTASPPNSAHATSAW